MTIGVASRGGVPLMFRPSRQPKRRPQKQTVMTVEEYRDLVQRSMLEDDWMQQVIDYAVTKGWRVYHTHDSRRSDPGFHDIFLVRRGVLVSIETKREGEKPTIEQWEWACDLQAAGVIVLLAYPHDWLDVEVVLA